MLARTVTYGIVYRILVITSGLQYLSDGVLLTKPQVCVGDNSTDCRSQDITQSAFIKAELLVSGPRPNHLNIYEQNLYCRPGHFKM